jgi:hypothetical protein
VITSVGTERTAIWIHDEAGERQVSSEGAAALPRLSRDGRRVFYLHRADPFAQSSELREQDVASSKSASLLPGWSVRDFDVSPDETEVVFTVIPSGGESQVWLASLDRRSPPREVTRGGTQVTFGANGEVIYRRVEKTDNSLYRIQRDGSRRERITEMPILEKLGVSPDGEWVAASVPAVAAGTSGGPLVETVAFPVHGGTPRRLCAFGCPSSWSADGRFLQMIEAPPPLARPRCGATACHSPLIFPLSKHGMCGADRSIWRRSARRLCGSSSWTSDSGSSSRARSSGSGDLAFIRRSFFMAPPRRA